MIIDVTQDLCDRIWRDPSNHTKLEVALAQAILDNPFVTEDDETLDDLEQRNDELSQQVDDLANEVDVLNEKVLDQADEIENLKHDLAKCRGEL